MTTRCLHLDLLESLDSDAFLLSMRLLVARWGKRFELLCDNGTNFTGGCHELKEATSVMPPQLQKQLEDQKTNFRFNWPAVPHFGRTLEREVKSVKTALRVILKEQSVPAPILQTLLIEVEGILNAKPLGYVSTRSRFGPHNTQHATYGSSRFFSPPNFVWQRRPAGKTRQS